LGRRPADVPREQITLQENYTHIHTYNHRTAIFSNWFENILMFSESDSITEGGIDNCSRIERILIVTNSRTWMNKVIWVRGTPVRRNFEKGFPKLLLY